MKNQYPIVFCHGLFGWGNRALPIKYWGVASETDSCGLPVFEASVGPVSSFHDRACELAAQIKGTRVDYGWKHAAAFDHERFSDDFTGRGFHSAWSEDSPIHLVGHSAGAHTILRLQYLLFRDYWGWCSNEKWVKSISAISGVLNGSTFAYFLGCSKLTGLIDKGSFGDVLVKCIKFMAMFTGGVSDSSYNWNLDQWGLGRIEGETFNEFIGRLNKSGFGRGKDNLAYDLTLQGCFEANQQIKTFPNSFYFSYVTAQSKPGWFGDPSHYPELSMNPALLISSVYIGRAREFEQPPIAGWGAKDLIIEKWVENDGLVSSISQRYPFTAGNHPVIGEGIHRNAEFEPGGWYWEKIEAQNGRSWDHGDIVFGVFSQPTLIAKQKKFYKSFYKRLAKL
jgi:triacylglycerol esterase/lipase EstA (alpha/beta hydrolase family)